MAQKPHAGNEIFMKDPTEEDYERLSEMICETGQLNTYELRDLYGEEESGDLDTLMLHRLKTLEKWSEKFVDLVPDRPFGRLKKKTYASPELYYICFQTVGGIDFHVGTSHVADTNLGFADYILHLKWEESFSRSELPEFGIVDREWNSVKGEIPVIENTQFGFVELARKIIEIDKL